jgi:hypothetical protein
MGLFGWALDKVQKQADHCHATTLRRKDLEISISNQLWKCGLHCSQGIGRKKSPFRLDFTVHSKGEPEHSRGKQSLWILPTLQLPELATVMTLSYS